MQTRATLHSALNFRPSDLKSLACSHEYSFFVHLSKDKSDCLTLVLSHYSLCFVFAKCQNIAVLLLQGYITLSALKKKKKSKWYNTLEKRKRFGWCWKKKKKSDLASYNWQISPSQQPARVNMALLSTNLQRCYYGFTTLFMKSWASLESITWTTILGKREKLCNHCQC